MRARVSAVRSALNLSGADALLVSNPRNVYYLTGFSGISLNEKESMLLVTQDKLVLSVPEMYAEKAQKLFALNADLKIEVLIDSRKQGLLKQMLPVMEKVKTLAIEAADVSVHEYSNIKKLTHRECIETVDLVEHIRAVKDEEELQFIKKAVALTDQTYETFVKLLRLVGHSRFTELECVEKIREISLSLGGEGFGFEPVIACGPDSSQPHYVPTRKKLQKNAVLLIDLGVKYKEYTGDLTRCVFLGKINENVRKTYNAVVDVNTQCVSSCIDGTQHAKLYQVADAVLSRHNVDRHMPHSLGHGIGLAIHELPFLRPHSAALSKNMVITIEPGVYVPGKFGVRVEDVIVVGQTEPVVLSKASRELVSIV